MTDFPPALLDAIAFATRAHRSQMRKDKETPYVSHVFRVCLITRQLFGVADPDALMAAVLHDTIEDTTTDYDDLDERFGAKVAGWVALLSKDTRLPDEKREKAYMRGLSTAPWQVKVCKLADIYDNLSDSRHLSEAGRQRTLSRTKKYMEALRTDLPAEAKRPFAVVTELIAKIESAPA
jgi:guanosine-3',5'-bis(diphosphate) 3'-pyrophosphohydrolase